MEKFVQRALQLAAKASLGERSGGCYGALVVCTVTDEVMGEGYNQTLKMTDPTWHAEMQAIREACRISGRTKLGKNCVLVCTSEPSPMSIEAAKIAGIEHIVYILKRTPEVTREPTMTQLHAFYDEASSLRTLSYT